MADDYDTLIEQADLGIEQASDKLDGGRLKDTTREDLRVDYFLALNKLLKTKLDTLRARDEQQDEHRTRVVARKAVESQFNQLERRIVNELPELLDTDD